MHTDGGPNSRGALSRRDLLHGLGIGAGAVAAGPLLSACGSSGGSSNTNTITAWHGWTGGNGKSVVKKLTHKFNENESKFRLRTIGYGWDTLFTKLPLAAQSGTPPNLAFMHPTEIPQFVDLGVLRPVDDLVQDVGLDLSKIPREALDAVSYKGKQYGVPGDNHPLGMYFNTDMAEAAGLDPAKPPKTGEELLEWVERLTVTDGSKTKQYGALIPYHNSADARWLWWSLLYQYGGTFLNEDNTRCVVDGTPGRKSLQFLVNLFERGFATSGGGAENPFAARKAATHFTGPWVVPSHMAQKIPFDTAKTPVIGTQLRTWTNSHCFVIPKGYPKQTNEQAMSFIKWLFRNYALPGAKIGLIPLNPEARHDPTFTDSKYYPYYKPFIEMLDEVCREPAIPSYTKIFSFGKPTPLTVNFNAALSGKKKVDEALQDMADGVNQVLRGS